MKIRDIERHAAILERQFDYASSSRRQEMRPEVERMIRTLSSSSLPIPGPLRRVEALLEADADEDLFDNVPI